MNNELETPLQNDDGEHWLSIGDLMSGLMMVFLLISIVFMLNAEAEKQKITEIAVVYQTLKKELYDELSREFKKDFPKWKAELKEDLTIRFKEPTVLFNTGQSDLKIDFKRILKDFFPRYIKIINSNKYRDSIKEIRIEGHTSSFWNKDTPESTAYFSNMKLSQERTRKTLIFLLQLPEPIVFNNINWIRKHVTANGLSSSKLIYQKNGIEDYKRSQRVEFRIISNAEEKITEILELQ